MENKVLQEGECFISDIGRNREVQIDDQPAILGRYAVIKSHGEELQVLEVGNDLNRLMEKYHIAQENVGWVVK